MFDLTAVTGLAVLAVSFIGGICGGVWGIGAHWIIGPPLLVLGVPAPLVVGCSTVHMAAKSLYPVWRDRRELDWAPGGAGRTIALPMALGSALTVFAGVQALAWAKARGLAPEVVGVSYGVLLAAIVGYGLYGRFRGAGRRERLAGPLGMAVSALVGLGAGVFAGFLGIGGGLVRRPALAYLIRTEERHTGPIGQFTVLVSSVVAAVLHGGQQNVQWDLAALLCVGGIVGQAIGNAGRRPLLAAGRAEVPETAYLAAAAGLLVSQVLGLVGWQTAGRVLVILLGVGVCLYLVLEVLAAKKALKARSA